MGETWLILRLKKTRKYPPFSGTAYRVGLKFGMYVPWGSYKKSDAGFFEIFIFCPFTGRKP